jgi:hypothetical protein
MTLRDDTARTLAVLSAVLLASGLAVGSPGGQILLCATAALPALAAAAFGGRRGIRLLAAAVLVASAASAVATYPACRAHMDGYRARSSPESR